MEAALAAIRAEAVIAQDGVRLSSTVADVSGSVNVAELTDAFETILLGELLVVACAGEVAARWCRRPSAARRPPAGSGAPLAAGGHRGPAAHFRTWLKKRETCAEES
jgi:hypothetical protein